MNLPKPLLFVLICIIAVIVIWALRNNSQIKVSDDSSGRQGIAEMFAKMSSEQKWNLEDDMLWGFFFTNPTKDPLVPFSKELEKMGYRVVDIYLDDEQKDWWLHVEKIEIHTVDSLYQREAELRKLAATHNLGSYDGWDVGPVLIEKKS